MRKHFLITAAMLAVASPALAQSQGEWTVGLGFANVNPKKHNGTLADGAFPTKIGDSTRPTITFEYFIRDNIGIEVLGAWPFSHKIKSDGDVIGNVKQLPPVVSLQYHFEVTPQLKPFLGLGINYTNFYDTDARGPLKGNFLRVKNSWGVAGHVGTDYWFSDRGAVRVDARWIHIKSDVKLNGDKIGEVKVNPVVLGASYIMKF